MCDIRFDILDIHMCGRVEKDCRMHYVCITVTNVHKVRNNSNKNLFWAMSAPFFTQMVNCIQALNHNL
jgi:hypothetical protein